MKAKKSSKKDLKLAHPVTSLANKIASIFYGDDAITTKFFFNKSTLRIICEKADVASALASICKSHFDVGNLFLDVQFFYIDDKGKKKQIKNAELLTDPAAFTAAFKIAFGNCLTYSGVVESEDPFGTTWHYLLGDKVACQWENDDTRNPWGITSCLPEEIFTEFMEVPNGVKISTKFAEPN